jgi:rhomboid protease GluP
LDSLLSPSNTGNFNSGNRLMAIGVYPTYATTYSLEGLTGPQFLALAIDTASRLGWPIRYLSASGFIAASLPWVAKVEVRINADHVSISSTSIARELWDRGKNKQNIDRFVQTLDAFKAAASPEYLEARVEGLLPYLPPPEADALSRPTTKSNASITDAFAIFKPVKGYFITPIIVNLNVLVFLLMVLTGVSAIEPDGKSLIAWGANFGPATLSGEYWRLLTCCFVHIGVLHLFMNMYAFLLIGAQLEPRLGKLRFSIAYIVCGIAASAMSLYWHENINISAGASGAIFGMYGLFLALLNTKLVEKRNRKQLLASVIFFVGYNLLGGLKEGIDNAAHVGGLITGLLIGFFFIPGLRKEQVAKSSESGENHTQPLQTTQEDYYP